MKSWIREKKYECGEYRTVGIYAVTDQEHRQRGPEGTQQKRQHAQIPAQSAGEL